MPLYTRQLETQGALGYVFKTLIAVAITAGTPVAIWTPASGKRFRLLGFLVYSTNTAAGVLFEDTSGVEFLRFPPPASSNITQMPITLGLRGYLSTAINNVLFLDVTATANINGFVYGMEE